MRSHSKVLFVFAALLPFLFLVSTSFAGQTRLQTAAFDGADSDAGVFSDLRRLASHQSTETIYAIDSTTGSISKFNASGAAQDFSALSSSSLDGNDVSAPDGPVSFGLSGNADLAVDNSSTATNGRLYVLNPTGDAPGTYAFDSAGNYLFKIDPGPSSEVCGVAVDSTGHAWVADASAFAVVEYDASGTQTGNVINTAAQGPPCRIAFDSADNLYATMYLASVEKYDSTGTHLAQVDPEETLSVTVDPVTNHLFAAHNEHVSEYDATGAPVSIFGQANLGASAYGVAVLSSGNFVYVSDRTNQLVHVFGPLLHLPEAVSGAAGNVQNNAATIDGTVDPEGVTLGDCHFSLVEDAEFQTHGYANAVDIACIPAAPSIPTGTGAVPVSAELTGLSPFTTYHFRLSAANANGSDVGMDQTFTTHDAPSVSSLFPGFVTDRSANLGGIVNPGGRATIYYLQYSTDPAFSSGSSTSVPATQDGAAGSGMEPVFVAHTVEGLSPSTTYHYRVVAENEFGTTIGKAISFTTLASSASTEGLPDGRVWERVSPVDKNGGAVLPGASVAFKILANLAQASSSGDAVAYTSDGHFGAAGGGATVEYIARRGPSGWLSEGISPAQAPGPGVAVNAFQWLSEDLSWGAVLTRGALVPGDPTDARNLYLRNNGTGEFHSVFTGDPIDLHSQPFVETLAATEDGSHVVLSNGEGAFSEGLFEWTNGELRNVAVLPDGTEVEGAILGDRRSTLASGGENLISADGSRLFFTVLGGAPPAGLYARDNGTHTTLISGSERAGDDPTTPWPAEFELASEDGSIAVFRASTPLADDVRDGLYRWDSNDPEGERLTDITADTDAVNPQSGDVLGVVGASDDASSVYFVDTGKLTNDANANTPNLYLWREEVGVSLVATLTSTANSSGNLDRGVWNDSLFSKEGDDSKPTPYRDARITPDGRFIAFGSYERLTAYDTSGTKQIYLYDSISGALTCASCSHIDSASQANSWFFSASTEDLWDAPRRLTRNLSPDGKRLFFDSKAALVPRDTNGVSDVYEWHEGRIDLISGGTNGAPSRLLDASKSGDDVFFTTLQKLVPSDLDGSVDLYDARVGGREEPSSRLPCVADECQGTPSMPRSFQTPSSSSFSGQGSSRPSRARCSKGKVRRSGRCTKRKGGTNKKGRGKRTGSARGGS